MKQEKTLIVSELKLKESESLELLSSVLEEHGYPVKVGICKGKNLGGIAYHISGGDIAIRQQIYYLFCRWFKFSHETILRVIAQGHFPSDLDYIVELSTAVYHAENAPNALIGKVGYFATVFFFQDGQLLNSRMFKHSENMEALITWCQSEDVKNSLGADSLLLKSTASIH